MKSQGMYKRGPCDVNLTTPFAIQLDDTILPDSQALSMACARHVNDGQQNDEYLFARTLPIDTKGQSIF